MEFKPILSERIRLRKFRHADGEAFWRYRTEEAVAEFQGSISSYTKEQAITFAREQSDQQPNLPETWFQLAIELISSGELIGDCGIHTFADCPTQVEIGITIARAYQGMGYAREALTLVLDFIFGLLRKERVIALTDPRNIACIRLLESLGMQREALLVSNVQVRGTWLDDVKYFLPAEKWLSSHPL